MQKNDTGNAIRSRVTFVKLDDENYAAFPAISDAIEKFAPEALAHFYAQIANTPQVSHFFQSKSAMQGAQQKQLEHWRQLFARPLDDAYFMRAEKIGHIHAQIGLEPTWYIGGYAQVLEEVIGRLLAQGLLSRLNGKQLGKVIGTMVKAALIDMDVALSAYFRVEEGRRQAVIDRVGAALGSLASGDFTVHLTDLPSEYEKLASDFEAMRSQMADTLTRVAETADSINTGSTEISSASDDLAQRTEQQAASLEETAAAMEEITGAVRKTAEGASQVNHSVTDAHRDAEEGGRVVREAIAAMSDIENSSQEIAQIINVIDGIAFQTNLLALNAGVEAARAGDAGKGFAVVANEVRALAQRSADAARHIKELIGTSSKQVERGVSLVGRTGEALDRIVTKVGEITEQAREISNAADAQANGLQQVNVAVADMDKMTQQNAAMVEESTAAARSLASEANQLAMIVNQFHLKRGVKSRPAASPATGAPQRLRAASRPASRGNLALAPQADPDDWTDF